MRVVSRIIAYVFVATCLCVACIDAAVAGDTTEIVKQPALRKGATALTFRIVDASLGSFDGAGISGKYHLTRQSALRGGMSYSAVGSSDGPLYSTGMTVNWVHYTSVDRDVLAYWTMGPAASFSWRTSNEGLSKYWQSSWTDSMVLGLGTECFLAKRISLLAEYRSSLYYYWSKYRVTFPYYPYSDVSKIDAIQFSSNGVRFGLSVYF